MNTPESSNPERSPLTPSDYFARQLYSLLDQYVGPLSADDTQPRQLYLSGVHDANAAGYFDPAGNTPPRVVAKIEDDSRLGSIPNLEIVKVDEHALYNHMIFTKKHGKYHRSDVITLNGRIMHNSLLNNKDRIAKTRDFVTALNQLAPLQPTEIDPEQMAGYFMSREQTRSILGAVIGRLLRREQRR